MNSLTSHIESIVKNNGGSAQDWKNVSSIINSKPDEAKAFCTEIKLVIKEVPTTQKIIALDLIDYAVVGCTLPLHNQVSSKDFITFLLTILKMKDAPEVQFKILTLIKKWGLAFENKKDVLPNFFETYNSLLKSGVVFPENTESTYYKYLNNVENSQPVDSYPDFSNFNISSVSGVSHEKPKVNENVSSQNQSNVNANNQGNYSTVTLDLKPEKYPKKYKKFVGELETLLNYITLANEMIDNVDYKGKLDEGVREMVSTVRDLDKNLQLAIENQIDHEDLLAICLGINDDINKLFKRYDDVKAHRKPEPFFSSFHTDYIQYNLHYREGVSSQTNSNVVVNNQSNSSNVSNVNDKNQGNANLIDFDFFGGGNQNSENVISNNNQNTNVKPNNQQNSNQNPPQKINDINDIFDAFK